jgi:hypothetical protein
VTNDNTDLFCGVFRQRTKRIVLYNVKADRPFELVDAAIRQYAQYKGVHISYTIKHEQSYYRCGHANAFYTGVICQHSDITA